MFAPESKTMPRNDDEVARRADAAIRRALNTPPKQHKDMKKGARRKKREDAEHPTASGEKRD
jgi:hypothetical protein